MRNLRITQTNSKPCLTIVIGAGNFPCFKRPIPCYFWELSMKNGIPLHAILTGQKLHHVLHLQNFSSSSNGLSNSTDSMIHMAIFAVLHTVIFCFQFCIICINMWDVCVLCTLSKYQRSAFSMVYWHDCALFSSFLLWMLQFCEFCIYPCIE